jgi:formylglycine-generating enzyme required for sulfatase activity
VRIPAGEFIYQDGERRVEERFWITRHPVTRAQFETFLLAKDGFHNRAWWRGLARDERQRRPGDQEFEYWNHPRENVSWYDAIAFSRWLTARARKNPHLLPPELRERDLDFRITLPTEWQWERAASGTDGREYPWGAEYKSGYANVDETWDNETWDNWGPFYLKKTSAVGMYPHGESPEGVLGMSGNVWEWCLNEYENPDRIQEAGDAVRVLRGGSWNDYVVVLASARLRNWFIGGPYVRYYAVGFRLVVVSVPK